MCADREYREGDQTVLRSLMSDSGWEYNILALIDSPKQAGFTGSLSVVSLEKDRALLRFIRDI